MGKVLQPLRAALTGTTHSPGMTEVVSLLGRERVLGRLGRALTALTQGLPDDRPVKPPKDAHSADESREGAPL